MPRPMSGWFKLWRSAVKQDMELTAHEFKMWYLLQTLALHTDASEMKRGTMEGSYSDLRVDLSGGQGYGAGLPLYSNTTLSNVLARLVDTERIVRLEPGKGRQNRLRFRIREWDLMQHGQYDAVPGRDQAGWLKLWRSALYYEDMAQLSPAEFKLWVLLLSMASHAETDKFPTGAVRTSWPYLGATLQDLTYKPGNLSRMLATLEATQRIEFTTDKRGELRIQVQNWDLFQHRNYDQVRWDEV